MTSEARIKGVSVQRSPTSNDRSRQSICKVRVKRVKRVKRVIDNRGRKAFTRIEVLGDKRFTNAWVSYAIGS